MAVPICARGPAAVLLQWARMVPQTNGSGTITMPPRREAIGCTTRRNVEEPVLPNAPEVQPQEEVSNVEFREAIRILSQVETNQVGCPDDLEVVKEMRSRMNLFVPGLGRASTKVGRAAMLIGDIDISKLMVYVQEDEEEKLRDIKACRNKTAKIGNESRQQMSNANRSSLQQKQIGHAPSSASAPTLKK
ncbi:uncharacterized protein LOC107017154 [Solanum pennellii]|uniref:Uncharacterized protein LOC107017154 n=1 Tax=Solanum pennellii TaxID=28526 RepID=A0ABM1GLL7_SOLPN|nr:uncharacterized protein LOC107017154 [Solanum pennellii]